MFRPPASPKQASDYYLACIKEFEHRYNYYASDDPIPVMSKQKVSDLIKLEIGVYPERCLFKTILRKYPPLDPLNNNAIPKVNIARRSLIRAVVTENEHDAEKLALDFIKAFRTYCNPPLLSGQYDTHYKNCYSQGLFNAESLKSGQEKLHPSQIMAAHLKFIRNLEEFPNYFFDLKDAVSLDFFQMVVTKPEYDLATLPGFRSIRALTENPETKETDLAKRAANAIERYAALKDFVIERYQVQESFASALTRSWSRD